MKSIFLSFYIFQTVKEILLASLRQTNPQTTIKKDRFNDLLIVSLGKLFD